MNARELVLYGGLFHDIGKVLQRVRGTKREAHPKISGRIIEQLSENQDLKFIVEHHHEKAINENKANDIIKMLSVIVCEADTLSSGEREYSEVTSYNKALESIFNRLNIKEKKYPEIHYQKSSELDIDDYIFPVKESIKVDYQNIWEKLIIELENMEDQNFDTILSIMNKYLWCIPSAYYKTVPDVSIYEHSRLTAAIAICIYDFFNEQYNGDLKNINDINSFTKRVFIKDDEVRYILLCGDITGIQNYIYNIAYEGAAKNLKGRSLYIQVLLDSISQMFLEEFHLPYCNLLYSSGGKFYMLIPKLKDSQEKIKKLEKKLITRMLNEFDLTLGIVFSNIELNGFDFKRDKSNYNRCKIVEKWDELSKQLDNKKYQKYAVLFNEDFFEPYGTSGYTERCCATGVDIGSKSNFERVNKEDVDIGIHIFHRYDSDLKTAYKPYNKEEGEEGQEFYSAEQVRTIKAGYDARDGAEIILHDHDDGIDILGLDKILFTTVNNAEEYYKDYKKEITILNDSKIVGQVFEKAISQRLKFYGGPWSFKIKCNPYEYEKDNPLHSKYIIGPNQPGVLRMDVDNLGKIFKDGFKGNASFSRIIQLSSMLDFFFAGLLNRIRKMKWDPILGINSEKGDKKVEEIAQIIYSGGDDVCIVGTWYVLPDIAKWITGKFRKFVGENESLTISAGISLFPQKYPIYKAAKEAGVAEDKAKHFKKENNSGTTENKTNNFEDEKNAICFLDTVMCWNDFNIVSEKVKMLYGCIIEGKEIKNDNTNEMQFVYLNRGIVNRLQRIYEEFDKICNKNISARWRWRAAYSLHRLAERNKDFKNEIDDIAAQLIIKQDGGQEFIFLLCVVARWTELLTRKE